MYSGPFNRQLNFDEEIITTAGANEGN